MIGEEARAIEWWGGRGRHGKRAEYRANRLRRQVHASASCYCSVERCRPPSERAPHPLQNMRATVSIMVVLVAAYAVEFLTSGSFDPPPDFLVALGRHELRARARRAVVSPC